MHILVLLLTPVSESDSRVTDREASRDAKGPQYISDQYRDNYERIFGKKQPVGQA
jgi:hypothetical protein